MFNGILSVLTYAPLIWLSSNLRELYVLCAASAGKAVSR